MTTTKPTMALAELIEKGERWRHFFGQISLRDKWFGLSG
jgi:hypothetical protein